MRTEAISRRRYWIHELARLSGSFGDDATRMAEELSAEVSDEGVDAVLDHLRLCGAVPEHYGHDSSEEKLYSKYTDAVVREALSAIGLRSTIITARADSADVQARASGYSLVADAKAFRLSRTAKNQKDFKVQAMDGWRSGNTYATVVCPVYQLPSRSSQIYRQAIAENVCILTYSHLAALVSLRRSKGPEASRAGLNEIMATVSVLPHSKSALDYWTGINRALVGALGDEHDLWRQEKVASVEALAVLRDEALFYLRKARDELLALSHEDAIKELIRATGIESRIAYVEGIGHGPLLEVQ
ncbi:MAG: HindIII family type II restriction endonuclease [Armatimonadetes bacterium]|nr:HindIII family type II restriction endonuclease [Armatimonadota bacterium]